jgi:hypothetical protein
MIRTQTWLGRGVPHIHGDSPFFFTHIGQIHERAYLELDLIGIPENIGLVVLFLDLD